MEWWQSALLILGGTIVTIVVAVFIVALVLVGQVFGSIRNFFRGGKF
jgi:hypothetical protein